MISGRPLIMPWFQNRLLGATITASETPLADTPLSEMKDPRLGRRTIFPASSVDIDFDLGARSPYNITVFAMIFKNLSAAGSVVIKSKAAAIDAYTTQATISLFTPATSDGFDGFAFEERGFDEYPPAEERIYPDDPPYFCLFENAVNHRFWRCSVSDVGSSQIEASLAFLYNAWEVPAGHALTTSIGRDFDDLTEVITGTTGIQSVNPGARKKRLRWSLEHFKPSEAWGEVSTWFITQGKVLPYFVILSPPSTGANVINTADDTGRRVIGLTGYGRLVESPSIDILSGYGTNIVDVTTWELESL